MDKKHALVFALAQKFLEEFIPAPLRNDLEKDFEEAARLVQSDPDLNKWVHKRIFWMETWQGLLNDPTLDKKVLSNISEAIFHEKQLNIKYGESDPPRFAKVNPRGLVKRDRVFYLVCSFWNFKDSCLLPLHRIRWAGTSNDPAPVPEDFNLNDYLKDGFPFEFPQDSLDVKLLFRESVHTFLRHRPLKGTTHIDTPKDGWFEVKGKVPNKMELRWWLLGFHNDVRILEPKSLAKEIQTLLIDPLTGLCKREVVHEHLDRLLAGCRRKSDKAPAIGIVDIDHFKKVNDTHGHAVGDAVLKEVARRLQGCCRETDVVGRWGGEEFIVILPDIGNEQEAVKTFERFRESVSKATVTAHKTDGPLDLPITVSIGVRHIQKIVQQCPLPDEDHEKIKAELIGHADAALYHAKDEGRDQVCLWEETMKK